MGDNKRGVKISDTSKSPKSSETWLRGRRYRIILLTIVTFGVVAMLVALGTVKPLIPVPERPNDTLWLYALTSINFISSLVLLAVLTRNILKLRRERAERRLGSKFKTKMVVFSIGISLLPGVLLFFFAYGLLNTSLDIWFSSPTRSFFESAEYLKQEFMQREINDLAQTTGTLMHATGLRPRSLVLEPPKLADDDLKLLRREFSNQRLLYLQVSTEIGILLTLGAENVAAIHDLDDARAEVTAGRNYRSFIRGPDLKTIYVVVGIPIKRASRPVGGVYTVRQLPQSLADSLEEIARQAKDRDQLSRNAKRIKVTNLYLLGAMTLLLIFAATWTALYVARGITTPIQALAEATQAVARGDFDARVTCHAEDELATLVQSFNEMASQLSENSRKLEFAAEQLRDSNRAFEERRRYIETILQSLSTGIISLDANNNLNTINKAALSILGLENAPAAGAAVEQLFASQNQAEILRLVRRARRVGHLTREMELAGPSVSLHSAVTITSLRDGDGTFSGSVLMIEDISELINAQRSAVWSEVARRMAHEIKNPLTPIQLSAERIAKNSSKLADSLDPKYGRMVEECTNTIKQEVGTLQRMVDEFSRFARLPQANPIASSLNEVVCEAVKLYDERLDNIRVEMSLAEDLPLVSLDREQIKRVLVNLIDNAAEAMADCAGERIIRVATNYQRSRDLAVLAVSDNGHGIAPGDREKLFQPYFSTRKRGTGLGLAIVSHIINDHNGKIRVEENKPQGARFIIELPTTVGSIAEAVVM